MVAELKPLSSQKPKITQKDKRKKKETEKINKKGSQVVLFLFEKIHNYPIKLRHVL